VRDDDLVGDRFFVDDDGRWRDLATGRQVDLIRRVIDRRWAERELALIDEWYDARGGRLVDFGRTGTDGWFEARLKARRRAAIDVGGAAGIAAAINDAVCGGASHVYVGDGTRRRSVAALFVAARALRRAGYVPIRASLPIPPAIERALTHRHVAFLVGGERDRAPVAAHWWRAASIAPRHHLVVDCRAPM
jgi:hypothetical protein